MKNKLILGLVLVILLSGCASTENVRSRNERMDKVGNEICGEINANYLSHSMWKGEYSFNCVNPKTKEVFRVELDYD